MELDLQRVRLRDRVVSGVRGGSPSGHQLRTNHRAEPSSVLRSERRMAGIAHRSDFSLSTNRQLYEQPISQSIGPVLCLPVAGGEPERGQAKLFWERFRHALHGRHFALPHSLFQSRFDFALLLSSAK